MKFVRFGASISSAAWRIRSVQKAGGRFEDPALFAAEFAESETVAVRKAGLREGKSGCGEEIAAEGRLRLLKRDLEIRRWAVFPLGMCNF